MPDGLPGNQLAALIDGSPLSIGRFRLIANPMCEREFDGLCIERAVIAAESLTSNSRLLFKTNVGDEAFDTLGQNALCFCPAKD